MRLCSKADFEEILRKHRPLRGRHLSVWIRQRKDNELPRAGLIVGKAVSRLAVIRNRWKRQLRESMRSAAMDLNAGSDIVLKPHAGQEKISSEEMLKDLKALISRHKQKT